MQDLTIYILAFVVMAAAGIAWFATKDTPTGRKVGMVAIFVVIGVLVLISMKRRIPIISNIIAWVKDRFADSKIEELDKNIKDLETKKNEGVASADAIEKEAEDLRKKAQEYKKNVDSLNSLVKSQIVNQDAPVDAGLPPNTGDAMADSKALLEALKQRRKDGRL